MAGYPWNTIPFGHFAGVGVRLNFTTIYANTAANRRRIVTTVAELQQAVLDVNAGTLDVVALSPGIWTTNLYNTYAITAQRTSDNPATFGCLTPNGVTIGASTSPTVHNINNLWRFSGASYVRVLGLNARYAYRNSTEPYLFRFTDAASNNLIQGGKYLRCGASTASAPVQLDSGAADNVISLNWFDDYRLNTGEAGGSMAVRIESWAGSMYVNQAVNNGNGTATYRFRYPDDYTIAPGDYVLVRGFAESEYNVTNVLVQSVTYGTSGYTSFFTVAISGNPSSPGTPLSELGTAMAKNYNNRCPTGTIIEYNSFTNFYSAGTAGQEVFMMQNGNNRVHHPDVEVGNTIFRYNWMHNCVNSELSNDKCSGTQAYGNVGTNNNSFVCRIGNDKHVWGNIMPSAGITVGGANHVVELNVCKEITARDGGKFDGTNNGSSNYDNLVPDTTDCLIRRNTILDGTTPLSIAKSEGYAGLSTDNVPVNLDVFDNVIVKTTSGVAVSLNNQSVPTLDLDGTHFSLSGGATAGVSGTNSVSSAANFLGKFTPAASTPSSILSGGEQAATNDAMGAANFAGKGALAQYVPDWIYEDTFATGSFTPLTNANYTPETNETGSAWITPTVSWYATGDGDASSLGVVDAANLINSNSTNHRVELDYNAGGATNLLRVWLATNSTLSVGYYVEFNPNQSQISLFKAGVAGALWSIPYAMSGTATIRIWGAKKGDRLQWNVDGMPVICVEETGLTGTYVGFQAGSSVNSTARILHFNLETDQASGGGGETPATPVISYSTSPDGFASNTNFVSVPPDIGDGQTLFSQEGTDYWRADGAGRLRSNTNNTDDHFAYTLTPAASLTNNSADCQIKMVCPVRSATGGSARATYFLILRWQDSNNFYAATFTYAASSANWSVGIYKKVSGAVTQLDLQSSVTLGNNDTYIFEAIGDALSAYVNGSLVSTTTDSAITAAGLPGAGMGNLLVATHDIDFNSRVSLLEYTELVEDEVIDPTAPVWTNLPVVTGGSDTTLVLTATADIASKHYVAVHNEGANYAASSVGVGKIIAGDSPTDAALTTVFSDTGVLAGEEVTAVVTGLDALTVSGKAPALVWWGYTATASDDTEMTIPALGERLLPAPVTEGFNPSSPQAGDFYRVRFTDLSTLSATGFVLTQWPAITVGSVVEVPYLSFGGYPVVLDPSTGDIVVDTNGNSDTVIGINMFDYTTRDWVEDPVTGLSYAISGSVPIVTSDVPNLSGTDLTNTSLNYTFIPSQTIGAIGGAVLLEGVTITNSSGNATVNVNNTTPGILIMTDESGGLFIQKVTPTT